MIPSVTDACPPGGVRWTDGRCVPEGIVDIPAPWVLDIAVPILAAAVLMVMVVDALRRRRLTWWLLISVTSASCWWLETFGDWGQHLSYSPEFHHYVLGWPKTAPHNPLWMPLMYAVYWVAHAWAILRLAQWLQRRRGVGLGTGILVLSVPVTWVWNLVIEGFAAYMGWWTYQPPIGPYIDMGRGNWPLLWPMLVLFGWINLIAWMVGPPEDEIGCNRLERMFRLDRLLARPGWSRAGGATVDTPAGDVLTRTAAAVTTDPGLGTWRFQLVRFLAWAAFFQATFVLTLDLPLVALRTLTGWDTPFS